MYTKQKIACILLIFSNMSSIEQLNTISNRYIYFLIYKDFK
jgi:hypothetical protein